MHLYLYICCEKAFPIQLLDVGNLSLSALTNERTYLRTADEDDDVPLQYDNKINSAATQSSPLHHNTSARSRSQSRSRSRSESWLYSYTLQDLKHLVQYAADRGITVIPEIDMPAHTLYVYANCNCSIRSSNNIPVTSLPCL